MRQVPLFVPSKLYFLLEWSPIIALWVFRTGSASDRCALKEELDKCRDAIHYSSRFKKNKWRKIRHCPIETSGQKSNSSRTKGFPGYIVLNNGNAFMSDWGCWSRGPPPLFAPMLNTYMLCVDKWSPIAQNTVGQDLLLRMVVFW